MKTIRYECDDGTIEYIVPGPDLGYEDGPPLTLSREDGPARYNEKKGIEEWFLQGRRHRLDGPAKITSQDGVSYWVDGYRYDKEQFDSIPSEYFNLKCWRNT